MRLFAQRPNGDDTIADLQGELVLLREENTRLRLERSRELGVQRVIERARAVTAATDQPGSATAATELASAQVLRETLLDLCREVSRALALVEQQLHSDTPMTEVDRRITDRRSTDRRRAAQHLTLAGTGDRPPSLSVPAELGDGARPSGWAAETA